MLIVANDGDDGRRRIAAGLRDGLLGPLEFGANLREGQAARFLAVAADDQTGAPGRLLGGRGGGGGG